MLQKCIIGWWCIISQWMTVEIYVQNTCKYTAEYFGFFVATVNLPPHKGNPGCVCALVTCLKMGPWIEIGPEKENPWNGDHAAGVGEANG